MSEAQMRRISYLRSIVKDRDAEIERLRAALELFACDCLESELCKFPHACRNYIARAALDGQPALGKGE